MVSRYIPGKMVSTVPTKTKLTPTSFNRMIMRFARFSTAGLYYDSFQNDIGAERAFLEATRANAASIPKKITPVPVLGEQIPMERKGSSK